ncbi:MAG: hypothetical protein AAGA93_19355 [Actinomycetota bacterium]
MTEVYEVATSFPAVVWTALVVVSVGFWLLSSLIRLLGIGLDVETGGGSGSALLDALGLGQVPAGIVATVVSLVGWLLTTLAVLAVGGDVAAGIGVVLLLVSVVGAGVVAGRVARVLRPLYDPNRGTDQRELVGRICTVRTRRVDGGFGQAEVVDPTGAVHLIQVRCSASNELTAGSRALVVDVDDGVFSIDPDVEHLI